MSPGSLIACDVRLRFAAQTADLFHIAELTLQQGASLGIRGASGAGKTTLFHCLAGLARPNAGAICWGENDVLKLTEGALDRWRRRHLGLIFQDFHLIDGLSALDNVLLPAHFDAWHAHNGLRERARSLLDKVGIATQQRHAALLSRGERQRVAIARAMLFKPRIVMADEPTASLDPEHRRIVGDLLINVVRDEGASLIVISHEQDLLSRMDRCMTLSAGTLHADRPLGSKQHETIA